MLDQPNRFQWGWVVCAAWDYVPMDVGELIAEEFVVDLFGLKELR